MRTETTRGGARTVAWLATLLSISFSVVWGVYGLRLGGWRQAAKLFDPALAVLTITLVAVIWYTYFTYRIASARIPTRLVVGLNCDFSNGLIRWVITNHGEVWSECEVLVRMWFDSNLHDVPDFFERQEVFMIPVKESLEIGLPFGSTWEGRNISSVLIAVQVCWTDQFGFEGIEPVRLWLLDVWAKEQEEVWGIGRRRALLRGLRGVEDLNMNIRY